MSSDVEYNREKTIEAWHQYIETGMIPDGYVRRPVADSWRRCHEAGVNPFGTSYPHMSRSTLKQVQSQYSRLLSYAIPCIRLMRSVTDGGASLTSPELFTYYMLSEYESDPLSYGIYLHERTCGNTAISIAYNEQATCYLHKYEKYRLVDQSTSSVATPIRVNGDTEGFLSVNSLEGIATAQAVAAVEYTAGMISRILEAHIGRAELLSLISGLIELGHRPIMVLDSSGRIVASNNDCSRFLRVLRDDGSPAMLADSLVNREDIVCFLPGEKFTAPRSCNLRTIYGTSINFDITLRDTLSFPDAGTCTIVRLSASTPGRQVRASQQHALPSLPQNNDVVEYVGSSIAWSRIDLEIKKIAKFPSNVFLQGESGTGKEVVARSIHKLSGRSGNFVAINCGDIPEGLLQSELFGYEKGSFTGANREGSMGKFEYADHGTVFLDEIGDMPLSMQVSLLRFIQERTVQRIGSNKQKSVDVRIIAATNKNIEQMVKDQQFRSDLYYRLNIIGMTLPPLRERKEDIMPLAQHFIKTISSQYHITAPSVDADVYDVLARYDWPGNVRELRNVVEKLLIMSDGHKITVDSLYTYIFDYDTFNSTKSADNSAFSEKDEISQALSQCRGNVTKAAAMLGITRDTLYRKMKKYDITNRK